MHLYLAVKYLHCISLEDLRKLVRPCLLLLVGWIVLKNSLCLDAFDSSDAFCCGFCKVAFTFFILPFTSRGISSCFEWKRIQPGESEWQCSLYLHCKWNIYNEYVSIISKNCFNICAVFQHEVFFSAETNSAIFF